MARFVRSIGLEPWQWRTCWKSIDFWLTAAIIVLPFGPLLVLPLRWTAVQDRVRSLRRS